MIQFKVLSENRDNYNFKGESGLSVWINAFDHQFLLDTGYSDLYLKNAKLLGIDLTKIEKVILTHGHSDHTNGVPYLSVGKKIILHPAAFKDRWSIRKKEYVGFPMNRDELKLRHSVIETKEPFEFYDNCYFLGEIPMVVDFEKNGNFSTTLDEELTIKDFTEDDSGIAITTEKGLFIMTGCGHRGVCNTIEHAKKVTGQDSVWGVLGGFHLRNLEKQKTVIDQTINYFKQNQIKNLFLGHCVTDEVIDYVKQNLKNVEIHKLSAGKEFDLSLCELKQKEF